MIETHPVSYTHLVGMVFQSFNLFNNMTVLDNCTAGLRYVLHQDKETAKKTALENLEKAISHRLKYKSNRDSR